MAVNIGPKIGIDGEKEYRKQVNDLITQQKTYNAEMRELESSFDDSTSAMEKAQKKGKLLEKQIENQEKQVEELEKGLKASAEKYGDNATETQKWKQAVANAKTELNKMRSELDKTPRSLEKVGKKMQAVGKKMQSVGDGMTKYVTAPIAGLAAASIAAFNEVDEGMDIVVKKTGATGEALASLQQSAKDIATTIPTSFEEAGSAVGEVNTKFGLVGDDLEALSTQFIKFAQLNDTDVSSSIDKTQKVLQAFGMETEDAGALLDVLNTVGQNTGISMDTLTSSMTKNAAALSEMGMSATGAAKFLGQVEMSGANTETVMSGMQKALVNAAEDGKTLPEALAEFQSVMDSTASDQEKLNAAIDLFGKKAGPAIYQACNEGSLHFEDFSKDLDEYSGNIETTFENTLDGPDKMQVALNQVKEAGAQMGEDLLNIAAPLVVDFANVVSGIGDKFNSLNDDERKFVEYTIGAFAASGLLLKTVGGAVETIGTVAEKASGAFSAVSSVGAAAGGLSSVALPLTAALGTAGLAGYVIYSMTQDIEAKSEDAIALIDAQKENVTTLQESVSALDTALASGNESIQAINDQSELATGMIDELEDLEKQSNKTAEQEARMKFLVADLNRMYPGLNANIDTSTGSLNKSTKEIRSYVKQASKMALLEAYTRASTEAMDKYVQANHALYVAQQGQQETLDLIAEKRQIVANMIAENELHPFTYSANEIQDINDDIDALTNTLTENNAEVEVAQQNLEAAGTEVQGLQTEMDNLAGSTSDATEATKENTQATEDNTAAAETNRQSVLQRAASVAANSVAAYQALQAEQDEWDELYKAAKESIESQVKLFEEWQQDSEVTFSTVLANMKSQTKGMRNYASNLETLAKAAAESGDENFKAFVQTIADMGIEGAAIAEAMVSEMEKEGGDFNRVLRQYGKETGAEENLAAILAYIQNDFQTGTESGAKAFNAAIDEMGEDSVMGKLRDRAKTSFDAVKGMFGGLKEDMEEGIEPQVQTEVTSPTKENMESVESTIEDGVKPEVQIKSVSVLASAYESARNAMQNYFNNNPIIAKLKATTTKHSEGGFTYQQQLSWLSEGNKPEVVIPLDSSKRERAISLFMQTGEVLGVSDLPTKSSTISIPGTSGALSGGSASGFGINADELYAAVAQGAAAGMESANIRIYWDNREAGRIMRDMGVQFA